MAKKRDWRYWRNLVAFTLCTLAAGVGMGIARVSYQGAMTYVHPPRAQLSVDDTPTRFGIDYQEIRLLTRDGVELSAWYTAPKNGAVILVAHGYGGARSAALHALFVQHGYGVISWDARAHGLSGGDTCTMGFFESLDVEAALDFALRQDTVEHVGAFGQSMGAATIIRAAAHRSEIEAVVADSAYPTLEDMIDRAVPSPVLRPFVRWFAERETRVSTREMRPVDEIGRISPRPIFIIQGANDNTVPRDSAQRLYDAAGEPRTLWIGDGIGHVGMRDAQPDEYDQRVFAFLDSSLIEK